MERIFEFIHRETPGHAEEIWSAVNLLSNTLENTQSAIDGTILKLAAKRDYDKANEYISISKEMVEVIDIINEYIQKYALNIEESIEIVIEDDETENYSDETQIFEKISIMRNIQQGNGNCFLQELVSYYSNRINQFFIVL